MQIRLTIALIFLSLTVQAQEKKAFQEGEWFKFRVSYGFLKAGYATLQVTNGSLNDRSVYHVKGYGKNTGMSRIFFKVDDRYETYIDKDRDIPYRFIRDIHEGGYERDIQIDFDQTARKALVHDKIKKTKKSYSTPQDVHDMMSVFYYFRNRMDELFKKEGDVADAYMFYGDKNFKFRLKFLRRETIKTKFGRVSCMVFRPYVESGRVFKEKESLTIWISDDGNKLPLKIEAELAVGSLKAELDEYKGLKHWFKIQK